MVYMDLLSFQGGQSCFSQCDMHVLYDKCLTYLLMSYIRSFPIRWPLLSHTWYVRRHACYPSSLASDSLSPLIAAVMLPYVPHPYVPLIHSYTIQSHIPGICQHTNCDVRCVSPKVIEFVTQFLYTVQLNRLLRYCLYSCSWIKFRFTRVLNVVYHDTH